MQNTTNYGLRKPEPTDYFDVEDQNYNSDLLDSKLKEIEESSGSANKDFTAHLSNKENPHGVTKKQVGLENVPNVTTNNQTPTYTEATTLTALVSGEVLSTAFGKIAKAVSSLISHLANTSNPHSTTASQVGLGNVPNVATNNQTPTYTVASANTALVSGEALSTAFGKIAKAVNSLISHLADTTTHITSAERTAWNAKVSASGTVANATNADTLDGLHASSFIQTSQSVKVIVSTTAPTDTTAVWIVPS